MRPALRRPVPTPPASFVARLASVVAIASVVLFSGCSTVRRLTKKSAPSAPPVYLPATHVELGRILSHDPAAHTALVEFSPFANVPANLPGQILIARKPHSLEPTARLKASPHRTGRVFGVYVVDGAPSPDDEVVIPPATEAVAKAP